jgi:hypothetical protein
MYRGVGGGLYRWVGGGVYTGVGGGLYRGVGGGLYRGADSNPYMRNWAPPTALIAEMLRRGMNDDVQFMLAHGFLEDVPEN